MKGQPSVCNDLISAGHKRNKQQSTLPVQSHKLGAYGQTAQPEAKNSVEGKLGEGKARLLEQQVVN